MPKNGFWGRTCPPRLPVIYAHAEKHILPQEPGFFCGRPCDMELVTRQYERPGNQQRLLQTFTEVVFIFSLLVYIAHLSFLDDALYKFTYLLTYLLPDLQRIDVSSIELPTC